MRRELLDNDSHKDGGHNDSVNQCTIDNRAYASILDLFASNTKFVHARSHLQIFDDDFLKADDVIGSAGAPALTFENLKHAGVPVSKKEGQKELSGWNQSFVSSFDRVKVN